MSFGLLPVLGVVIGALLLSVGLWLMQRLRVQHREVEVISTLFWQAALKETRARVFVKRFRHWPAWLLLCAIACFIWFLLAQPFFSSFNSTQHIVLLNFDSNNLEQRELELQAALARAASLPKESREIVAAGNQLSTLLAPNEELELARIRAEQCEDSGTEIQWALEALSARANEDAPLAIHLIGSTPVEERYMSTLPSQVKVYRVPLESPQEAPPSLVSLGFGDAASGDWNRVDVHFAFDASQEIPSSALQIALDGESAVLPIQLASENNFRLLDVAAEGAMLTVLLNQKEVGALSLPKREPIRVQFESGVPEVLLDLVQLDDGLEVVQGDPEVRIGFTAECNLRLSGQDASAFEISAELENPELAMLDLIDELALKQIDATSLAQQSGEVVDVQVRSAPQRSIAVWSSLFTPSFDFVESRACPIFVARSLRWLANHPEEIHWAARGDRLPAREMRFNRVFESTIQTVDGRDVATSQLSQPVDSALTLEVSPSTSSFFNVTPYTWLGILVSALLVGEWILYQRGRIP